jgi:hypothetical protein
MLSNGERYYLTIGRSVLLHPFYLFWLVLTVLFMIKSPPFILLGLAAAGAFLLFHFCAGFQRLWTGCGYRKLTYVVFHILVLAFLV